MAKGVAGLDPENGALKWKLDGHDGSCICTPVWGDDNILFISGAYGVGARGIKLTRTNGKTEAEGHRRRARVMRINQNELMSDIDRVLLLDKPSRLTDKRIP